MLRVFVTLLLWLSICRHLIFTIPTPPRNLLPLPALLPCRDEAISFWAVLSRAQTAGHVLLGYYVLPSHIDQPIESTINPQGLAVRSKRRVWNTGDGRLKFLIVRCV